MSAPETGAAGAAPPRPRRRRRLAAAIRALLAEEARPAGSGGRLAAIAAQLRGRAAPPTPAPVLDTLRSLAVPPSGGPAPADADPAELLARIPGPPPIPAEVCVAVASVILPLLRAGPAADGPGRDGAAP